MSPDFLARFAEPLGISSAEARPVLTRLIESIHRLVEEYGGVSVPGLGTFRRDGDLLAFEPAPDLADTVNHRYAGLAPLVPRSSAPPEAALPTLELGAPLRLNLPTEPPLRDLGDTADRPPAEDVRLPEESLPDEPPPEAFEAGPLSAALPSEPFSLSLDNAPDDLPEASSIAPDDLFDDVWSADDLPPLEPLELDAPLDRSTPALFGALPTDAPTDAVPTDEALQEDTPASASASALDADDALSEAPADLPADEASVFPMATDPSEAEDPLRPRASEFFGFDAGDEARDADAPEATAADWANWDMLSGDDTLDALDLESGSDAVPGDTTHADETQENQAFEDPAFEDDAANISALGDDTSFENAIPSAESAPLEPVVWATDPALDEAPESEPGALPDLPLPFATPDALHIVPPTPSSETARDEALLGDLTPGFEFTTAPDLPADLNLAPDLDLSTDFDEPVRAEATADVEDGPADDSDTEDDSDTADDTSESIGAASLPLSEMLDTSDLHDVDTASFGQTSADASTDDSDPTDGAPLLYDDVWDASDWDAPVRITPPGADETLDAASMADDDAPDVLDARSLDDAAQNDEGIEADGLEDVSLGDFASLDSAANTEAIALDQSETDDTGLPFFSLQPDLPSDFDEAFESPSTVDAGASIDAGASMADASLHQDPFDNAELDEAASLQEPPIEEPASDETDLRTGALAGAGALGLAGLALFGSDEGDEEKPDATEATSLSETPAPETTDPFDSTTPAAPVADDALLANDAPGDDVPQSDLDDTPWVPDEATVPLDAIEGDRFEDPDPVDALDVDALDVEALDVEALDIEASDIDAGGLDTEDSASVAAGAAGVEVVEPEPFDAPTAFSEGTSTDDLGVDGWQTPAAAEPDGQQWTDLPLGSFDDPASEADAPPLAPLPFEGGIPDADPVSMPLTADLFDNEPVPATVGAMPPDDEREQRSAWPWLLLLLLLLALPVAGYYLWQQLNGPADAAVVAAPAMPDSDVDPITGEQADPTADAAQGEVAPDDALLDDADLPSDPFAGADDTPDPAPADEPPADASAEPSEDPAPAPVASGLRGASRIEVSQGGYTWVVTTDVNAGPTAQQQVAQYRAQGYRSGIVRGLVDGTSVERVCLGQFATLESARQARSQLPPGVSRSSWVLNLNSPTVRR
ncbi:MAG: SPOR domain-containing protein [Bacteroidota bacterium]